ncbi:MAG: hypothetical protein ACLQFW_24810 [Xanthobacteraceae bacterium]
MKIIPLNAGLGGGYSAAEGPTPPAVPADDQALLDAYSQAADDLIRALTGDKIGRSVALDVLRGIERLTISLVPEERKRAA